MRETTGKLEAMQTLGVPYTKADVADAVKEAKAQSAAIADGLTKLGLKDIRDTRMVALIAYLQRVGTDVKGGAEVAVGGAK
jgi:cytochrome c oxidase cbb3-type subunit I/II